ncbi:hypothetical protein H0H81_000069 [Sphagnurus paluster]|uniref:SGNH hydrolase-type esterase domain-containing protein n=1 Tax=Sphagnurus paluster TaxID=117069 RepID=A0A9P7GR78_9AGAR|nr:hypothetical protein H0H81_000069 [Sphagnurus paluster]
MTIELHPANVPQTYRSGRWQATPSGSLVAYWCGASLKFRYTGRELTIRTGVLTERKDRLNGGTPMFSVCISGACTDSDEPIVRMHDAGPSEMIQVYCAAETDEIAAHEVTIEITLIDWASVFELDAILTTSNLFDHLSRQENDIRAFEPPPTGTSALQVLWIGDSISCGYSDGSQRIPQGCLDAFPFRARELMRRQASRVELDLTLVAFPGITLTDGDELGMVSKLFKVCFSNDGLLSIGMAETLHIHRSPLGTGAKQHTRAKNDIRSWWSSPSVGTNDDLQGVPAESFQVALTGLASLLSSRYATSLKYIMLIHPFPNFDQEETKPDLPQTGLGAHFPSFLEALWSCVSQEIKIFACNIAGRLRAGHTMDGLHPTVEGNAILADGWIEGARTFVGKVR